jgi:hypothetical protein
MRRLGVNLSVIALAIVGSVAIATPPAQAKPQTYGAVTMNCGIASCSWYLSRSATKELNSRIKTDGGRIGAAVSALGLCKSAHPIICFAVAANGALAAISIQEAAENHPPNGACFKITKSPVTPFYYSTNNGKYCKD